MSTSYRGRGSPSPRRSYKVHLFGPAFNSEGKRGIHHATRVTRSISAQDLYASHVYTSQDQLLAGPENASPSRACSTSLQDLFHKGPFHPDATAASESGVSLGGLSDESLSLCGGDDLDNLSLHSFGSSSAFHEITFDSEHDRCDSSDAYFSGAEGGNYSGSHHHSGDRSLDVLYEDHLDGKATGARRRTKQNVPSPLSYGENRRRELQFPSPTTAGDQDSKAQAKLQAIRVLIPGTDVTLRSSAGDKEHRKSPGEKQVLSSTPLAQSTPHVSPRGRGEVKLSILASWNADDSLEEQPTIAMEAGPSQQVVRALFDADTSDAREGSSCNSSHSEDNFSDISSATQGSLTARRTKLVKRPWDKPASSKLLASLEDEDTDTSGKGSPECGSDPGSRMEGETQRSGIARSSVSVSKSQECDSDNGPKKRLQDSDNGKGGSEPPSAASAGWQDRQDYHEGNARVVSSYGCLSEDGEDDDGGEGDGENEDEDDIIGHSKKKCTLNKTCRTRGAWHVPASPTTGRVGHEAMGKLNIPLISAGKHGQEKLRKRLSQSSPPLSPVCQGETPPTVIGSDTKHSLISDSSNDKQETSSDARVDQVKNEPGPRQDERVGLTRPGEQKSSKHTDQDERSESTDVNRSEGNTAVAEDGGRSNDDVIASSRGDPRSDDPLRGRNYDRNAGPGKVTGIPALVTAGQFTNIASQGEGRGGQREGGREESRDGPAPNSTPALSLERGEDEEEIEGKQNYEAQVVVLSGADEKRVGEGPRSRCRSTSPSLAPVTASADDTEPDRRSSRAGGRPSEQSESEPGLGVTETTGRSTIPASTTAHTSGKCCDDSGQLTDTVNNAAPRIETTADADVRNSVSGSGADRFKSELKLTLTVVVGEQVVNNTSRNVNRISEPGSTSSTVNSFYSKEDNIPDVEDGQENEKEKPVFFSNSSDAEKETNEDLRVIGEARTIDGGMERSAIDPAIVAGARAASEGETQQLLVRVVATAQNSAEPGTVRQARHKNQSQQLPVTTEIPSQGSHLFSKFATSGYNNDNSCHSSTKGIPDSHPNNSFSSVGGLEFNNSTFRADSEHVINNNNGIKASDLIGFSEQEGNERDQNQSVRGNIPRRYVSEGSIGDQTSGCSHNQNKGIPSRESSTGDQPVISGEGRLVQKKEVITEVCHTVVRKTHSTTVEEKNLSTEPASSSGSDQCSAESKIKDRSGDRTKDTLSKTTTVEDVEDTVTTKTTTTTTTVDLDDVKVSEVNIGHGAGVNTSFSGATAVSTNYFERDGGKRKEQPPASSSLRRDGYRAEKVGDRFSEDSTSAWPSDHVMREVKPGWEARADPEFTTRHTSVSFSPSQHDTPGGGGGGVNLYPVKRHGDDNHSTSRLDSLQATLAQISGLEGDGNGAWSCDRDALSTAHKHTLESPSLAVPYHDHAEATSVLKQIVRGDTDGFPNFSWPGRPCTGIIDSGDDCDTIPENSPQVRCPGYGPSNSTYREEEPTRDNYTPAAQIHNGDAGTERESYDNDYDNAPSVTTALPPRQHHSNHHHHHHHLQLLKPGQLKASSLWTLQEETESLLEAVSPKPSRRTLTSVASDDEEDASVNGQDSAIQDVDTRPNQSSSIDQDLSDTAIGHKHCVSESSDFDDSDGNYSSISTAESASIRSSNYGREQTPMSDETEAVSNSHKMDYRSNLYQRGHTPSNVEGVSSFTDFVSGLEESLASPYTTDSNQGGNLIHHQLHQSDPVSPLDSLSESLRQFNSPHPGFVRAEQEAFPKRDNDRHNLSYNQNLNHNQHHHHHLHNDSHNSSINSTSMLSQVSWATAPPFDDAPSEASLRLHALDLDLSRISSCGSPAPSDISDASSAYTCTGTAQIKRQHLHVSFGDSPMALAAPFSPPTREGLRAPAPTSTPRSKSQPAPIIKRPRSPKEELTQRYVDEKVRQFDQILKDFQKRTNPTQSIDGIVEIVEESQQSKVLTDKTYTAANVSIYDDLYKAFTSEDAEKKQNNVCIVVEDENMSSYRFKRYLRKSHTKRKKGRKVMRFLNRLSCVSEATSSPEMSPAHKKLKTDNAKPIDSGVQTFSMDTMLPSPSLSPRLLLPNPKLTSSMSFQHHRQLEAPLGVVSSSLDTPPQGSPASSTQSVGSERSRADSAYSSVSESLSHGSVGSPGYLHPLSRGSTSGAFHTRAPTTSVGDRSFSTDSAYFGSVSGRTGSELDRTLVDSSRDDSEDMLSALSDVFEQLDVCEGEIDKALLDRMRHGHKRARPARRL